MKNLILLSVSIFFISCVRNTFHTGITASTTLNSVKDYKILGRVEETSCNRFIFVLFWGADYKNMYKKTFEDVQALGGDAMIDFQVRPKNTFYVISPFGVFFSDCWEATGIAIKMGTGNSFDEKPSQWDKTPDSENFEKKKVVPSKWDAAPKKTH